MTTTVATVRPRFTERQVDLLLAAVYVYQRDDPEDEELAELLRRLRAMQKELAEA